MQRLLYLIVLLLVMLRTASAGIVNGDFETGSLTPWSSTLGGTAGLSATTISTSSTDSHHDWANIHANGGYHEEYLNPITTYLVTDSSSASLAQTFSAPAGAVLKFDVEWSAYQGGNAILAVTGPGPAYNFQTNALINPSSNGWQTFSVPLSASGSYTFKVTASASDYLTNGVPQNAAAIVYLDNVRLVVPEPASWALMIGGGAIVLAAGWRKRPRGH